MRDTGNLGTFTALKHTFEPVSSIESHNDGAMWRIIRDHAKKSTNIRATLYLIMIAPGKLALDKWCSLGKEKRKRSELLMRFQTTQSLLLQNRLILVEDQQKRLHFRPSERLQQCGSGLRLLAIWIWQKL